MKIKQTPFHLTYCTNIHPGESWQEVFNNLKQYLPPLKSRLESDRPFGIGLRLGTLATQELLNEDHLTQFKNWLTQQNLYVFTLNGFPYGGFHRQVVKDQVYAPDWSQPERLNYTLDLLNILATLLPEGIDGGISTLPLSYKPWWQNDEKGYKSTFNAATINLAQAVAAMVRIQQETGQLLHLDLEPEPDGLIENAAEVVAFFQQWLLPLGTVYLTQELGISPPQAEEAIREHIRVCYDTCHFAVEYEDPQEVFSLFKQSGIKIGKIQLSAALQVDLPETAAERSLIAGRLTPFAESTYLHQVIERRDGALYHYSDLALALPYFEQSQAQEWRTHFHVPIFTLDYQLLKSTQADIETVLKLLQTDPICSHLEIETYTWEVLPPDMKLDLSASIEREYRWVLDKFNH